MFATSLFLSHQECRDVVHKDPQLQREIFFCNSFSASCNTIRRSKQLHFDPGNVAVVVWSGSATHPSNCTRLWCSKQPRSTRNIFLGELRCVAQAHTTGRVTRSKAFARSNTKATAPKSSFPARYLNLSISTGIPKTVRGAPPFLPSVASPHSFPPPYQRRHERSRSLTCNILRAQEKHRRTSLLRPFSTLFHLLQQLHHFYSCFFCQVQGDFWVEAIAPISCFSLIQSRRLLQIALFESWQGFLQFFIFHGLSSTFCTLSFRSFGK